MVMPEIGAQMHVNINVVCPFLLCQFNQTGYCPYIIVQLPNIEFHKCRRCQVVYRQMMTLTSKFSPTFVSWMHQEQMKASRT